MPQTYLWKFLYEEDGKIKSEKGNCRWDTEWKKHDGAVKCCESGYHASEYIIDAFSFVKGSILAKVEVRGKSHVEKYKQSWQEMRIVKAYKWTKMDSAKLAIFSARSVLDIYEKKCPKDDRLRRAIDAAESCLEDPAARAMDIAAYSTYAIECAKDAAEYAAYIATFEAYSVAYSADAAVYATYSVRAATSPSYSAAYSAYSAASAACSATCAALSATCAANTAARSARAATCGEYSEACAADRADALNEIEKWILSRVDTLEVCTPQKKSKN